MSPVRRLSLALTACALAGTAAAQAPLTFTIDAPTSQFTFSGSTSIGPIVGMPPDFGLSGTVLAAFNSGTSFPVSTIRLAPGGDALVSPDLNAVIPNPVPFLPNLATVTITNLRLELTSGMQPVGAAGQFTVNVVATALSGTATVTPLGGAPSVTDLTGTMSAPQSFGGTVVVTGVDTRIEGPLQLNFQLMDPASGLTADLNVTGTFAADVSGPAPASYCTAAVNSTGSAARIGTAFSTSLFLGDLELQADLLPLSSLGYFLFSDTQGFTPGFGGSSGNLCLGGNIFRLSNFIQNSGTQGQVALALPFNGLPPGASFDPGETWHFQYWFRDTSPTGATSNTTDGVSVVFVP